MSDTLAGEKESTRNHNHNTMSSQNKNSLGLIAFLVLGATACAAYFFAVVVPNQVEAQRQKNIDACLDEAKDKYRTSVNLACGLPENTTSSGWSNCVVPPATVERFDQNAKFLQTLCLQRYAAHAGPSDHQ